MRTLLKILLRIFPENVGGIHRSEMEETVLDGYRASSRPFQFALRELGNLAWNGTRERVHSWMPAGSGVSMGPSTDRRLGLMSTLLDDLRLAFRKLSKKNLGFTSAAVVTLGVGIGATVAMFGVLNAALLRSLPYPDAQELILGRATFDGEMNMTCSFPDYLDHKEGSDAFEVMAATNFDPHPVTLTGQDQPIE